jgi:hypothetical protein
MQYRKKRRKKKKKKNCKCDCKKGNLQFFKGLQAFNMYSQADTEVILQV